MELLTAMMMMCDSADKDVDNLFDNSSDVDDNNNDEVDRKFD